MIEALMQICLNMAMALPPPPNSSTNPHPLPPGLQSRLSSALRRQGSAMVDFEDRYPQQLRQTQRKDLDRTTRGLYAFGTFVDAKTAEAWRKDWTGRGGPVRWWACEGRSGRELRECVKLKEEEEMMACGRVSCFLPSVSCRWIERGERTDVYAIFRLLVPLGSVLLPRYKRTAL